MSYVTKDSGNAPGAIVNTPGGTNYAQSRNYTTYSNQSDDYGNDVVYDFADGTAIGGSNVSDDFIPGYDDGDFYSNPYYTDPEPEPEEEPFEPEQQTTPEEKTEPGVLDALKIVADDSGLTGMVDAITEDPLSAGLNAGKEIAKYLIPGVTTASTIITLTSGTEEEKKALKKDIEEHPWMYAFDTALDVISIIPGLGLAGSTCRAFKATRATLRAEKAMVKLNKLEKAAATAPKGVKRELQAQIKVQKQVVEAAKKEATASKNIMKASNANHRQDVISKVTGKAGVRGAARQKVISRANKAIDLRTERAIKEGKSKIAQRSKGKFEKLIGSKFSQTGRVTDEAKKMQKIIDADKSTRASLKAERNTNRELYKSSKADRKRLQEEAKEKESKLSQKLLEHLESTNKSTKRQDRILARNNNKKNKNSFKEMKAGDNAYQLNKKRLQKLYGLRTTAMLGNAIFGNGKQAADDAYELFSGSSQEQRLGGQKRSRTTSSTRTKTTGSMGYYSPLMEMAMGEQKRKK